MKKKSIALLVLFIIVLLSCYNDETIYSCDPQINSIVKSGLEDFSKISLKEYLEYDIDLQKAIYRSFSVEKKISFWTEKLDYLVADCVLFTTDDIKHINKLRTILNTSVFENKEIENDIELTEFIENWNEFAKNKLKWTNEKVHFVTFSLYLDEVQYQNMINEYNESILLGGNCSCSTMSDDCNDFMIGTRCTTAICTKTRSGCGFFNLYECNGACR